MKQTFPNGNARASNRADSANRACLRESPASVGNLGFKLSEARFLKTGPNSRDGANTDSVANSRQIVRELHHIAGACITPSFFSNLIAVLTHPIPFHRPAETFTKIHNGLVIQQFPRKADICQGIANISCTRLKVCRPALVPGQITENPEGLVETNPDSCGRIHHPP